MVGVALCLAIVFLATASNASDAVNPTPDPTCVPKCLSDHQNDVVGVIACLPDCYTHKKDDCSNLDTRHCIDCCYLNNPVDVIDSQNCLDECDPHRLTNVSGPDNVCHSRDQTKCMTCCHTTHKPNLINTTVCLVGCPQSHVECAYQNAERCIACFYDQVPTDIDGLKTNLFRCIKPPTVGIDHTITQTSESYSCIMRKGKKLRTFGNTKERVKIPCKYHAISATKCGNYKVTVTPGNAIEADKDKRYIVKTMYVGVERLSDGMKWEGRSDLHIAQKFLDDAKAAPFNKKDGALNTTDVFNFGPSTEDDKVSLIAKDGSFQVIFGLYKPDSTWHKRSGFQFECFSADFEPSGYPDQLCGNGMKHEAATFKSDNGWHDRRQATTFYSVFMNQGIAQTDSDCKTTADTMAKKCDGFEYEAAQKCWKIVGRKRFQRCITKNLEKPESAMRHCVEYVCSNYTDPNSCLALYDELDGCQNLVGISEKVKAHCAPNLFINY